MDPLCRLLLLPGGLLGGWLPRNLPLSRVLSLRGAPRLCLSPPGGVSGSAPTVEELQ